MDFIAKRKIWFTISLTLILIGFISLAFKGLNLGIDFKGGSLIEYNFEEEVSLESIIKVLTDMNLLTGTFVQHTQSGDSHGILIRTTMLEASQRETLLKEFKALYPSVSQLRAESVWPTIGKELRWKAMLALIVAFIAIVLYISFRFELKLALAAIAALLHDVLIVVAFFSITGLEVNTAFVAGLLTIVGYSINDTIVIFDRIRENLRMKRKEPFELLLNKSIMQTLNRSINTVLTTILPLIALLLFGGATIKFFMLAMLIGFVVGAYTSIFISSPVLYEIKNKAA